MDQEGFPTDVADPRGEAEAPHPGPWLPIITALLVIFIVLKLAGWLW